MNLVAGSAHGGNEGWPEHEYMPAAVVGTLTTPNAGEAGLHTMAVRRVDTCGGHILTEARRPRTGRARIQLHNGPAAALKGRAKMMDLQDGRVARRISESIWRGVGLAVHALCISSRQGGRARRGGRGV